MFFKIGILKFTAKLSCADINIGASHQRRIWLSSIKRFLIDWWIIFYKIVYWNRCRINSSGDPL